MLTVDSLAEYSAEVQVGLPVGLPVDESCETPHEVDPSSKGGYHACSVRCDPGWLKQRQQWSWFFQYRRSVDMRLTER
jgi:hypothetical protein